MSIVSLDDCISSGGGTPSGPFPAPSGPLAPLTMAGIRPLRRGVPRNLDDCIAAGGGTPGTVPTEDELAEWEVIGAPR